MCSYSLIPSCTAFFFHFASLRKCLALVVETPRVFCPFSQIVHHLPAFVDLVDSVLTSVMSGIVLSFLPSFFAKLMTVTRRDPPLTWFETHKRIIRSVPVWDDGCTTERDDHERLHRERHRPQPNASFRCAPRPGRLSRPSPCACRARGGHGWPMDRGKDNGFMLLFLLRSFSRFACSACCKAILGIVGGGSIRTQLRGGAQSGECPRGVLASVRIKTFERFSAVSVPSPKRQ